MPKDQSTPESALHSRRQFVKKAGAATLALAGAGLGEFPLAGRTQTSPGGVALVLDATNPQTETAPVQWAASELQAALAARKEAVQTYPSIEAVPAGRTIVFIGGSGSAAVKQALQPARITIAEAPDSMTLGHGKMQNREVTVAAGPDARGMVYSILELADRVQYAVHPIEILRGVAPMSEQPANRIRGLSRAFVSDVEDKPWYDDRAFWPGYLTMLTANRFNRFNLTFGIAYDFTTQIRDCYFHFAYPFLLTVPGYDVRVTGVSDEERDRNLQMLRFISEEAVRRGLHFQLGLWTHAYQWTDSPNANHIVEGLTPATQAPYCRDALRALLQACPAISGVTIRTHGESGVPEGNYDLWKTILDGAGTCGRRVEIELHAKGLDQEIIDIALGTNQPVTISPKYWAEHMGLPYMQGAIRQQEMPPVNPPSGGLFKLSNGSRQFLRYGYGDLMKEDRRYGILHRVWPGTQRMLLWGDPQAAAAYGRVSSFCGSDGVEIFEPLYFKGRKGSGLPGGRDGYADLSLRAPGYDYEKYRYTYRIWGLGIYNPEGGTAGANRLLQQPFGKGAKEAATALALANRILPLVTTAHCPSAANNTYWPEMYTNMPINNPALGHLYSDTPSPRVLGKVSPLDPEFFLGIDEFAEELLTPSGTMRAGGYSPAWVARRLDELAAEATAALTQAEAAVPNSRTPEFRRLATDVRIQCGLGRFFAAKFRAGLLLALYRQTGFRPPLEEAIKANRNARAIWSEMAESAKGVYRPDVTYGFDANSRGHWLDRLPAMDEDIADMEKLREVLPTAKPMADEKATRLAIEAVLAAPARPNAARLSKIHAPERSFRRGQPLVVTASLTGVRPALKSPVVHLRYRRVNQAEGWQTLQMDSVNKNYRGEIPASCTDSPYPLQYYFGIVPQAGPAEIYPSLDPGWQGQPYFVVRQAV